MSRKFHHTYFYLSSDTCYIRKAVRKYEKDTPCNMCSGKCLWESSKEGRFVSVSTTRFNCFLEVFKNYYLMQVHTLQKKQPQQVSLDVSFTSSSPSSIQSILFTLDCVTKRATLAWNPKLLYTECNEYLLVNKRKPFPYVRKFHCFFLQLRCNKLHNNHKKNSLNLYTKWMCCCSSSWLLVYRKLSVNN